MYLDWNLTKIRIFQHVILQKQIWIRLTENTLGNANTSLPIWSLICGRDCTILSFVDGTSVPNSIFCDILSTLKKQFRSDISCMMLKSNKKILWMSKKLIKASPTMVSFGVLSVKKSFLNFFCHWRKPTWQGAFLHSSYSFLI